ncbi:GL18313 [Drosophila persimilis]|uniref:GL18313 n=1 Tax=Drosophila persimilis TaxID=7234 RepID=B4H4S5_DROPE|nr:GL18313 [Drosophila persimilis]
MVRGYKIHPIGFHQTPYPLRLITFQEWTDFLLHVHRLMFANFSALEEWAFGKVMSCLQSVNGEPHQTLDENRKLRKDLCAITKFLQKAYHRNIWDTDTGLSFVHQLLGISREQRHPIPAGPKDRISSLLAETLSGHKLLCRDPLSTKPR